MASTTGPIESAWAKFPGYEIDLVPADGTGRIWNGEQLIAESTGCVIMQESDHVAQLYFPVADIRWEHLVATDHRTVCPFKGEAHYWSLADGSSDNVVWAYPDPFTEVAGLAGHVAAYDDRLTVTLTEPHPNGGEATTTFPIWGTADDLVTLMDVRPTGRAGGFTAPPYPDPALGTFFEFAKRRQRRNVVEGGQLLGDLIVAAAKSVPDQRVTAAHVAFCRAASFDEPLDIDVDLAHRGRTLSTVGVRISQAERLRATGTAMLDVGASDRLRHAAPMPAVAGPDASPPLDMSVLGREFRVVDGAYDTAPDALGPPEIHVWARFRDDPGQRFVHQALLAQATTHWTIAAAMRPHAGASEADAHVSVSTGIMSASIAFLDDVDVTEWMLYSNPAVYAGNGLVQGEGRVYCIDGRLLATYSVQGLVRAFAADPASMGKDASNAM